MPPPNLPTPSAPRVRVAGLYLALAVSGFSALLYESTWGRMLQRVFGVSDLAVATVLAAFFLGLGLGSLAASRRAARLARPWVTYAALEFAIGAYALLSLILIPRVHDLYAWIGSDKSFEALTIIRLVLALTILLPPTCLMGATLPVVVAALSRREQHWQTSATRLYFFNTAGAVLGAGATGLWLVPEYGTRAAVAIAAFGSLLAGAIVLRIWRGTDGATAAPADAGSVEEAEVAETRATPRLAMRLAAAAGFTALAGEVLWTRVLRIILQGTTQAFAAMLVNYLAGIAIGSLAAERIARRAAHPLRAFAVAQIAVAFASVMAMLMTPQLPRLIGILRGTAELSPHEPWIILAVSAVLLFPVALVVGASIPLAWRVAGGGGRHAADHSGKVLAANTLGGLVGSLAAGFLLVPTFGVELAILIVLIVNLAIAGVALRASVAESGNWRLAAGAAPLLLGVLVCLCRPSIDLPFLLLGRFRPADAVIQGPGKNWNETIRYLREGRNTTVTITQGEETYLLCNDGRRESGVSVREPYFGSELALLGALPTLFAAQKERAMVVGLGAGHTTTMLLAGGWQRVDVVELEEAVVEAARALHELRGKPFPLDDTVHTRLIVDDARAQLALAPSASYDAVVSQPSHPWLAGSSALYTDEFFGEVRRALRPGGVFALWVNLFRMDVPHLRSVIATLLHVFGHLQAFVVDLYNFVLCAGDAPQTIDAGIDERFAAAPGLAPFLHPFGIADLTDLVAVREFDDFAAHAFAVGAPILIDDRPALEFDLARMDIMTQVGLQEIDRAVIKAPWLSATGFAALPAARRVPSFLRRIRNVSERREALARVLVSSTQLPLTDGERNLVEGALAAAVGDVPNALQRYDASDLPDAATAADQTRTDERRFAEALQVAGKRKTAPGSARPLLRCAAAVQTPEAIRTGLSIAGRSTADPAYAPVVRFLEAFASGGGEAAHALGDDATAAAECGEEFAYLALRAAILAKDDESARRFLDVGNHSRSVRLARELQAGDSAAKNGNLGAAVMRFRRVLAADPRQAPAAARLARVLNDMNNKTEATRVLQDALRWARDVPEYLELLVATAFALGIDLGVTLPASAADNPVAPDMGS